MSNRYKHSILPRPCHVVALNTWPASALEVQLQASAPMPDHGLSCSKSPHIWDGGPQKVTGISSRNESEWIIHHTYIHHQITMLDDKS